VFRSTEPAAARPTAEISDFCRADALRLVPQSGTQPRSEKS